MRDRTEQELERESNAAWDAICRELVGKEFYDVRTGGRYTIATVEAVHGRYMIGRSYLVRDNEGRLCEIVPASLDGNDGIPYVLLDPDAMKAAAHR